MGVETTASSAPAGLRRNAIGLREVLFQSITDMAPGAAVAASIPAGDSGHTPQPGTFGSHPVRVAAGSMLAGILPADRPFAVPTAHHQAIDRLGENLIATAWTADGVIEAAEMAGGDHHPFVLAVQWHPEADDDPRLFQALVAAAQGAPLIAGAAR